MRISLFLYFKIKDKPILDILYDIYKSMSIIEFMEESYEMCLKYESEIREHIARSEDSF